MNQSEFDNLPDLFAERTNGGHKGTGVLQFGYKNGFNKAIELLGARVQHAKSCNKLIENSAPIETINDILKPTGVQLGRECTCGLDTIMKGYQLHG